MQTNIKRQFTEAVRLLAPGNQFILKVARLVPEADLPPIAGVAAFELAATLETLQKSWRFRQPLLPSCKQALGRRADRTRRKTRLSTGISRITHHASRPGGAWG